MVEGVVKLGGVCWSGVVKGGVGSGWCDVDQGGMGWRAWTGTDQDCVELCVLK